MNSPVEMIRQAAVLLDQLRADVAFLGGAVVGLLVTDPAAREPRATQDVDVTIEIGSRLEYNSLEDRLRGLGFRNAMSGPICRFTHGELVLDVMPTAEEVLGFSNPWYTNALSTAQLIDLGDGIAVKVITAPCFIATKLAAFDSIDREGHGDYVASRDFEDIVTVIDGREEIVGEIRDADGELREYVRDRLRVHLGSSRFDEGVSAHIEIDAVSQRRVGLVLDRMRRIAQG